MNLLKRLWCWIAGHQWVALGVGHHWVAHTEQEAKDALARGKDYIIGKCTRCGIHK